MKAVKILLVAIMIVAGIIGISAVVKKYGNKNVLSDAQKKEYYSILMRKITELKGKTWSVNSWEKDYKQVKNEIDQYLEYGHIRIPESTNFQESLNEEYKLILEAGAESAIKACRSDAFEKLETEMDYFLKNGSTRFKRLNTSVKNYRSAMRIPSIAQSLTESPIEKPYPIIEAADCLDKATALRNDTLIMQCATIRDRLNLEKLKQILSDSHYEYLSKIVKGFLETEFETKQNAMEVAKPVLDKIKEYKNSKWYVANLNPEGMISSIHNYIENYSK
jgi:uncharacterized UPF0160 family protein